MNKLHLVHLYPQSMNTYGDTGNIICLTQRAAWRGIETVVHHVEVGDPIPRTADLYFFGGGQDAAQGTLAADLLTKAERLKTDVERGIPLLAICGGYQLLGTSYLPFNHEAIPGIGIFPVQTAASSQRMIGNLVITANPVLGLGGRPTLVGFENHSGKTTFTQESVQPLGRVIAGYGNNGSDKSEGCMVGNAIGCYLHGSLLPKNPHLADWLLAKALSDIDISPLEDIAEWAAHGYVVGRYSR